MRNNEAVEAAIEKYLSELAKESTVRFDTPAAKSAA